MNSKSLWITIVAAVFSFVAGFYFANTFNRGELDSLRSENERLKAAPAANANQSTEPALSDAEIRAKIEEADKNPGNFQFQKNLGLALYRYGTIKQDGKILQDALRILQRADTLNGQDREIKVTIGNTYFDIAYFDKLKRSATADIINKNFEEARKYYGQALSMKPDDVGVVTDIGLTYFLEEPAEYKKAADELANALKIDPNHERAIQFMVETKWRLGAVDEAVLYLEQLKTKFPNNPMIGELTSMVTKSPASP